MSYGKADGVTHRVANKAVSPIDKQVHMEEVPLYSGHYSC
jgi:hypothetical protein